jgi:hypothetical protein
MKTGYEISFEEFKSLLSDPEWRKMVAPLVTEWFGCQVVVKDRGFWLKGLDGRELDPLAMHEQVQADPEKQGRIYRTAMTLWR